LASESIQGEKRATRNPEKKKKAGKRRRKGSRRE
jgi:hypothetical protein